MDKLFILFIMICSLGGEIFFRLYNDTIFTMYKHQKFHAIFSMFYWPPEK